MLKYPTRLLLTLVCLWLATGPLAILQLGAWSWMIVSYSQESSLEQAVRETFSDTRPCAMCCLIDAVEEQPEDPAAPSPEKKEQSLKLMLGLARPVMVATSPGCPVTMMACLTELFGVDHPVPTPPPRGLA